MSQEQPEATAVELVNRGARLHVEGDLAGARVAYGEALARLGAVQWRRDHHDDEAPVLRVGLGPA